MILVVGVNGTGKTTTIGKLAYQLHEAGASVVIGAADTFRAAAAEQLETWAGRAQADFVGSASGSDPAAVAFDAVSAGVSRGRRVVIVDTAGRLHTQEHLMEELAKVRRVIAQRLPGAPHETLLTIDATTGQNGLQQARLFTQAAEVTGLVLTKLDGSAKGGIAIAIAHELGPADQAHRHGGVARGPAPVRRRGVRARAVHGMSAESRRRPKTCGVYHSVVKVEASPVSHPPVRGLGRAGSCKLLCVHIGWCRCA